VQQWYALSNEVLEDAVSDSAAIRQFVRLHLGHEEGPDPATTLKFRRLPEAHKLTAVLLAEINAHIGERRLMTREATMVDHTLINAPTSTKNRDKARDLEMHQTKKGNQWYHGIKAHIGASALHGGKRV
jgi:transposase, IS5 family